MKKKILYEAQFYFKKNFICRVFAYSEKEAIEKFKEIYPDKVVTKIYEP